jgi:hypothetical protein
VRVEAGVCTGFAVESTSLALRPTSLRGLPLGRLIEGAIDAAAMFDRSKRRKPITRVRGRRGYPREHFERIADEYRAATEVSPRPVKVLADRYEVPVPTMRTWLVKARREYGLLGPAIPGKAGEQPSNREEAP